MLNEIIYIGSPKQKQIQRNYLKTYLVGTKNIKLWSYVQFEFMQTTKPRWHLELTSLKHTPGFKRSQIIDTLASLHSIFF